MAATVNEGGSRDRSWGARLVVLVPYLWLVVFFLVPFLIVLKISLSQTAIAQPPYAPVFDLGRGLGGSEGVRRRAVVRQLRVHRVRLALPRLLSQEPRDRRAARPLLLLLIGFPLAYGMARAPRRWQPRAVRAGRAAVLDVVSDPHLCLDQHPSARRPAQPGRCSRLRIVDEPPAWLSTDTAVYIGIVYSYLPFMVLPHLRDAGEDGRDAARGRRRSRLPALEGVLAGDACRCRCRA